MTPVRIWAGLLFLSLALAGHSGTTIEYIKPISSKHKAIRELYERVCNNKSKYFLQRRTHHYCMGSYCEFIFLENLRVAVNTAKKHRCKEGPGSERINNVRGGASARGQLHGIDRMVGYREMSC